MTIPFIQCICMALVLFQTHVVPQIIHSYINSTCNGFHDKRLRAVFSCPAQLRIWMSWDWVGGDGF